MNCTSIVWGAETTFLSDYEPDSQREGNGLLEGKREAGRRREWISAELRQGEVSWTMYSITLELV